MIREDSWRLDSVRFPLRESDKKIHKTPKNLLREDSSQKNKRKISLKKQICINWYKLTVLYAEVLLKENKGEEMKENQENVRS